MSQAVVLRGNGSNADTFGQVDPTYDALRVSIRPYETQPDPQGPLGGHYFVSAMSGLMAAGIASAAQVFQVRWADSSRLFVLKKLKVQCSTCTGFAATTIGAPLQLFVGHGSTANGSGGTAVALAGGKGRASQGSTSFATSGEIRIATTSALTAATGQTLESQPIGGCMGADNRTLVSTPEMYLFDQRDFGDHPLILVASDTLAITTLNPAATGTWEFAVTMSWAEVVQF
jgi:hypothetical protein